MDPAKPTFLIIGAAKCGTTALASILASHPDCCISRPKEVCYFQDLLFEKQNPNYQKGWDWYQKAFSHYRGEPVIGEATPAYADRDKCPNTVKRIHQFNPRMKIVYMVRDPLERQLSAWKMLWEMAKAGLHPDCDIERWALGGLNDWMRETRDSGQWSESRYGYQLQAFRDYFPDQQVCVSFLEDWKKNQPAELESICTFLGLDFAKLPERPPVEANRAGDRKIERPFLKRLRHSKPARLIVPLLPRAIRDRARESVAFSDSSPPAPELDPGLRMEFIDYVKDDLLAHEPFRRKGPKLWEIFRGSQG